MERDPHDAEKSALFWMDGLVEVLQREGCSPAVHFWMGGMLQMSREHSRELDALRAEVEKLRAVRDPTTLVPIGR